MPSDLVPQSFEMFEGKDKTLTVTVTDDAGNTVDLTGGSGEFRMARTVHDTAVLTVPCTLTQPAQGVMTADLDDTDTNGLVGTYYYEFEFTDPLGDQEIVTFGYITIRPALIP